MLAFVFPNYLVRQSAAGASALNYTPLQGEVRVMAIAYPTDFNEAAFGVLVDQDGAVIDYCRMVHFLKRSGGFGPQQNLKVSPPTHSFAPRF